MRNLKVGKLYRHHMVKGQPGQTIRGCFVKRVSDIGGVLGVWQGGINTIGDITEYAGAMMLIEVLDSPGRISLSQGACIFLIGDRYIMLDPELVEPV